MSLPSQGHWLTAKWLNRVLQASPACRHLTAADGQQCTVAAVELTKLLEGKTGALLLKAELRYSTAVSSRRNADGVSDAEQGGQQRPTVLGLPGSVVVKLAERRLDDPRTEWLRSQDLNELAYYQSVAGRTGAGSGDGRGGLRLPLVYHAASKTTAGGGSTEGSGDGCEQVGRRWQQVVLVLEDFSQSHVSGAELCGAVQAAPSGEGARHVPVTARTTVERQRNRDRWREKRKQKHR